MAIPVLTYYDIADGVTAFSSTRRGGASVGSYGEFNVNEYCGDRAEAVAANRKSLCEELGIETGHLIMPHQTHGTEVRQIGEDFFSLPEMVRKMVLEGVDGVMTTMPNVCIGVSTADCIPVLLYDKDHRAACAVHAGWRGTVQRVVVKAIAEMRAAYHTDPAKLAVCIGPGISLHNFEVGDEVYQKFKEAAFPMERISRKSDKWHIDLWECNRIQLMETGVNPNSIQLAGVCTFDNADEYFSARRLGVESGRIFTGIMIK